MNLSARWLALAAALLLACGTVTVTPAPGALPLTPKDTQCRVEFWPGKPDRAFDELGEVKVEIPFTARGNFLSYEDMRPRACALGADAIINVHVVVGALGTDTQIGTAIRYRPAP